MTKAEMLAFNAGKTAKERGLEGKAPCYDPILGGLVTNSRSESGRRRNIRVLEAWYLGAGIPLPKGD